jgi:hypothetical protein
VSVYSQVRTGLRDGTAVVLSDYFPSEADQDKGIIFSHQNGAEPSTPYVVIQIVTVDQVDRTSFSTLTDEAENLTIFTQYEITAQFTFCGSLAGDMAYDFNTAMSNNVVMWEAFQKNQLAPLRKSPLRRLPIKRDTKWIEYQNLDVTFSYAVKTTQKVDVVERISILGLGQDPDERIYIPPLPTNP